jgi:hypothetical protein
MNSKLIFNGNYIIYDDGRLYSNKTNSFLKGGYTCRGKNYLKYCLCFDGVSKNVSAHRLVAESFIPNPNNCPQVNHIDGDAKNNNLNNLEWCTAKQNMQHARNTGLYTKTKCMMCGKIRDSIKSFCGVCTQKLIIKEKSEITHREKQRRLSNELCDINLIDMYPKYKNIVLMRQNGSTFQAIANKYHVSKQAIQYTINYLLKIQSLQNN